MTNPWVSWLNRSTVIGVSHVLFVNCELIHEGNWNCFWPPGSMKGQWLLLSLPSSQAANGGRQSYSKWAGCVGKKIALHPVKRGASHFDDWQIPWEVLIQIWVKSKRQEQMKWISAALFRPVLQRRQCAPTPQFCTWVIDGECILFSDVIT